MFKNEDILYDAYKLKDIRFDGKFFVGVKTTKIYCRFICNASLPKKINCSFFKTQAEAEENNFRPCLVCRPELAPGNIITSPISIAFKALKIIDASFNKDLKIEEVSFKLGISKSVLINELKKEYNISFNTYLLTSRLLFSKMLLTDTNLPVEFISKTSGFESLDKFFDLFKSKYSLDPLSIRKNIKNKTCHMIEIKLSYRPPLIWEEMLSFLEGRSIKGVEVIENNEYKRTVHIETEDNKHFYGFLKVINVFNKNYLLATISESLLPVLPTVIEKLKNLFDLNCDPITVYNAILPMNKINKDSIKLGTRLPGCFDAFEMATRAVLGQQITVKAASTLASRIALKYGTPIQTGIKGLTHIFPSSKEIADFINIEEKFGILKVTSARSRTIQKLAQKISENDINLEIYSNHEFEMKELLSIKGIGNWTCQYIAMRTMHYTDSFLETDIGIKKALQSYNEKEMLKVVEQFKPWRSYIVINLWNTLIK